jgi:Protein of unknown function (DUF3592)
MGLGVLFTLFGGFMTWVCGFTLGKGLLPRIGARRKGIEAEGRVVRFRTTRNGVGTTHIPIVTFTTPDGQKVEFLEGVASAQSYRQPGDLVAVRYDPADPAHSATVAGSGEVARSVAIFGVLTVFCAGMTVFGLLFVFGVLKPQ